MEPKRRNSEELYSPKLPIGRAIRRSKPRKAEIVPKFANLLKHSAPCRLS